MSVQALTNRSIRTIKLELEFLRDSDFIDPITLSRIIALLPDPEPTDKNHTTTNVALAVKAVPEPVKKSWAPVATATIAPVAAVAKPPLPVRARSDAPSSFPSSFEKTAIPSVPPPDLPSPPSYTSDNVYKSVWGYEQKDPTDLAFEKDELIIVLDKGDGKWVYGRSRDTGREGWVPNNRIEPATEQDIRGWEDKGKKTPIPPHDTNMMTNVAHGRGDHSGFSAPAQPPQEEGKGKSKLEENGKKFGSKLGNAAIFGAGATIGSKIVSGIF